MEKAEQNLIEKFFDQELSPEEGKQLKEKLRNDPGFKEEFLKHKAVIEGTKEAYFEELKKEFEELDKELDQEENNISSGNSRSGIFSLRPPMMQMAASFIILAIAAASGAYFLLQPAQHSDAFDEFYTTYPNVTYVIDRNMADEAEEVKEPFLDYEIEEYSKAYRGFDEILRDQPENHEARFYKGLSAIELGKEEEARKELNTILDNTDRDFDLYEQAIWYLALTHLKSDNPEKAKSKLKDYSFRDPAYEQKSQELIERIEKI